MKRRVQIFLVFLLLSGTVTAWAETKNPSKGLLFFYKVGQKIDNFCLSGVDTNYITLPEHSWSLALSNCEVGINTVYRSWHDVSTYNDMVAQTTPSIELGFNAGFRGFGVGYSWDVMHAYSKNWNISLGGKTFGLEFMRNVSKNLEGKFYINGEPDSSLPKMNKGDFRISTSSLTAWYALNSRHYSHNAAIKQDYIQRRTAGSLLLSVGYMSSQIELPDSLFTIKDENLKTAMDGVKDMITRQVAVGLGYGINYTPNQGKVLLHAAANMQLVCYSVNHVSYSLPDGVYLPGEPLYVLRPAKPVHVTGNMRAAVSWEINRWVHLSVWAQANHLTFQSGKDMSPIAINNWNWQAHIKVGVRFGAGYERVRAALPPAPDNDRPARESESTLPRWITDFFFSSSH